MKPIEVIKEAHTHYLAAARAAQRENEIGPEEYPLVRGLVQDHLEIEGNYLNELVSSVSREELEKLVQIYEPMDCSRGKEILSMWDVRN